MKTSLKIGWYVVYVRSRYERKVHEFLQENSILSFLPLTQIIKKWSDRKKLVEVPLFPSYVFVKVNSSKDFFDILSVKGVCDFLRCGRDYAVVSEKEIIKIKLLLSSNYEIEIESSDQMPKIGELKKINDGPLNGLECEVLRINHKDKIVVRLNSIRQNITTVMPSGYLSEISTDPILM
ncbi:UpxY family transcription antiterminator [Aquimarina sp. BL5]|uniref:UpxY family transcription antiterminator n=1 Tax=Aquimarina sp. BL5 TaxID=1714860 RepID=UPI000E4A5599|nr:UpxY family transcription antiterminator [Aquimarina sp. BL5]AXT51946.1 UpxY family transcription antiterminator [Aquimarina sp. BL5]RKN02903.1 UpxY family transcription antiterminator [Aquimarina sp. BL5]